MLTFLGPSAFVLLIAPVAGANVFQRGLRGNAFTGLLGMMVIFAGLLDGVVMDHHTGIAAEGTFFPTGTAISRIREVASNRSDPVSLRNPASAEAGPG